LEDLYFVKPATPNAKHDKSLLELQVNAAIGSTKKYFDQISYEKQSHTTENVKLYDRLRELEVERSELDKQRTSSCVARNLIYPLAMLLLLLITSITVLLVMQNTIELLIGIKALPLSSRVSFVKILENSMKFQLFFFSQQFTLGISSLSKLGVFGAALEIFVILYLGITSFVGFYTMPLFAKIRPKRRKTSLTHLITNSLLILILTSALPLLSRILGLFLSEIVEIS
jgi:LMBR1-like membrane protein